jgi:hypothetical protein
VSMLMRMTFLEGFLPTNVNHTMVMTTAITARKNTVRILLKPLAVI